MDEYYVDKPDFIIPRCTRACPVGVDVPKYIRAVNAGNYDRAIAVLREKLPFPTVCADACFAPCEDACAYRQFGDPIAIRAIKRVAVEKGGNAWKEKRKYLKRSGKTIAVIGAGPAGLTAGYYLNMLGHDVTVYDAFGKPGGMMRYGIPKYRLPEARLDKDLNDILEKGLTFRGATRVGEDMTLSVLKRDYHAVFISTGANSSAKLPLQGSETKGVYWGLEFLRDTALGKNVEVGKKVVVVGGGNVALDVALTAKRLGANRVDLFCLESRHEMPAHAWEIDLAEEEGIVVNNSWGPKRVLGKEKVSGIVFVKCTSVFDCSSIFNPVYDEDTTYRVEADTIILAIGQSAILDFVLQGKSIRTKGGRISVDEDSATTEPGIFAGGDVVTGPASIIEAISQGRQAAVSIDKYLGGKGDISEVLADPEQEVTLSDHAVISRPRNEMGHLIRWQRANNFDQVEVGLTTEQIAAETARCLNCDVRGFEVTVNSENCKECGYCVEVCSLENFTPIAGFNSKGYKPMESKSSAFCVGCFQCFFSCPDFAIDVREKRNSKGGFNR